MKKLILKSLLFVFFLGSAFGQGFKFAQVSDTHVGGSTGADDLRITVKDLNQQKDVIKPTVWLMHNPGDVATTNFGSADCQHICDNKLPKNLAIASKKDKSDHKTS